MPVMNVLMCCFFRPEW